MLRGVLIGVTDNALKTSKKVKVKFSKARSLKVEKLLLQNVGSIINYLQ